MMILDSDLLFWATLYNLAIITDRNVVPKPKRGYKKKQPHVRDLDRQQATPSSAEYTRWRRI